MRFSPLIVGGLIGAGLLNAPAMAVMPKPWAASPLECPGLVAVRAERMTLQQIAQIPRPRAPHRTIYSSKPELR